jgi:hypothetical protein
VVIYRQLAQAGLGLDSPAESLAKLGSMPFSAPAGRPSTWQPPVGVELGLSTDLLGEARDAQSADLAPYRTGSRDPPMGMAGR